MRRFARNPARLLRPAAAQTTRVLPLARLPSTMPAASRAAQISRHLSTSAPVFSPDVVPQSDLVKVESKNGLRVLTLNRPAKYNALTLDMIHVIADRVTTWNTAPGASAILLKGEGSKAFCAGGDIEVLTEAAAKDETRQQAVDFFRDEYEADSYIAKVRKPIVTFMDGITMGGGVGLSAHASFRVVTENTAFAMPETNIGLFPDVGGSFMLSRLDGKTGLWLGLTSDRLTGYDCYRLGIATHYISSDRLPQVEARLAELDYPEDPAKSAELVNNVLNEFQADEQQLAELPCSVEGVKRQAIDFAFSKPTIKEILQALEAIKEGKEFAGAGLEKWAGKTKETIEHRSPTSCTVAFLALQRGKDMDISSVFQMEMRIVSQCVEPAVTGDFLEGVYSVLILPRKDKSARGKRPAWNPSTLDDIDVKQIESDFFSGPLRTKLPVPTLENKGQTYKEYPHIKFALPREEAIGSIIKGESGSGAYRVASEDALLEILSKQWGNKTGLRAKVQDVLARRTKKDEAGNLQWQY